MAGMDSDIEKKVHGCGLCAAHQKLPPAAPIHHLEYPSHPWNRMGIDYARQFLASMFIFVCDAFSKWIDEIQIKF